MIGVASTNGEPLSRFQGYYRIPNPGPPVVAMPTTAGTGSEATKVAVITDTERNVKMMILDAKLMPAVAIVDYELTMSMSKPLTAHVGVDALTHGIEAYVSSKANPLTDPVAQELAPLWQERRDVIQRLVARAEVLGQQVAQRPPANVLCHADIHTNNVLLDAGGGVWVVDWDDTLLAPKERDLMFVVGGGLNRTLVGPREEEVVLQGYGATRLDHRALTYYRYARAVSDLSEYGLQVLVRSDLSVLRRQAAIGRFLTLFQPGRLVEVALASDEAAP